MSSVSNRPWLALDIGGANLKAADSTGVTRSVAFPLWKTPERLALALGDLVSGFPATDPVAITMTGELCDCYETKAEGVKSILYAAGDVFRERRLSVWCIDGSFRGASDVLAHPLLAAAANWMGLAVMAARLIPDGSGMILDIGSTTADLIPTEGGHPVSVGRTDTERLHSGELVYAGVRRTPVCALAQEITIDDRTFGLAAELFATTRDVYLMLGDLEPEPFDNETADGRAATIENAKSRLARMIGTDREGFSHEDAVGFAREADQILTDRLVASAERVCSRSGGRPRSVVVCGSGEFLAERVARRVIQPGGTILSLSKLWGAGASSAACAFALAKLAAERDGGAA